MKNLILIETKEDLINFYVEYMRKKLFKNNQFKLTLKDCIFQDPEKTKRLLEN